MFDIYLLQSMTDEVKAQWKDEARKYRLEPEFLEKRAEHKDMYYKTRASATNVEAFKKTAGSKSKKAKNLMEFHQQHLEQGKARSHQHLPLALSNCNAL